MSELKYKSGKNEDANDLLSQSIAMLENCFTRGSFLSGNLLAFMHRTPVPYLLESKPDIRNYERSLAINVQIAVDPSLHGLAPTYARNEAIDALLMGEVSIKAFPGLGAFAQLIGSPENAARVIGAGKQICGKKELKLVRALFGSRGGTLGDTRPFTVFYEFIADKYEYELYGGNNYNNAALAARHFTRLQGRLNFNDMDKPLDLLALISLSTDAEKASEYLDSLKYELDLLGSRLGTLADSPLDPTGSDIDHPYYLIRRFLYYVKVLLRELSDNGCQNYVSIMADRISFIMSRFEKNHPCMKT